MVSTYSSRGVRYARFQSFGGRWGPGRCHLALWRKDVKDWVLACQPDDHGDLSKPYGELVDKEAPITCKRCLRTISPADRRVNNQPTNRESDMSNFWDDPELKKAAEGGDYFKFNAKGDKIKGTVRAMAKKDFDGRTAVEVEFDDDRKVTFGQVLMLRELYTFQPLPGEQMEVELVEVEKKGAKTLKLFRGEFTRLNGQVETFDQTKK